jgi:phosphatidylserine decarboxylase
MKSLHRTEPFFRIYGALPHGLINRAGLSVAEATRPKWLVDAAIRAWIARAGIDMSHFEDRAYVSLQDFFLRRLRPGARPTCEGIVSPVDGALVGAGAIDLTRPLRVKGQQISVERLVNGGIHSVPLAAYQGGAFATLFLSPEGYHRVHMPIDAEIVDCRWIPGRYFPQNEDALWHIGAIYERNERAVLRCRLDSGQEFLMVLVGASLIGGIHLEGIPRRSWVGAAPVALRRRAAKGREVGHFAFGSTVVMLLPPGLAGRLLFPLGASVPMGSTLWEVGNV